MRKPVHMRKLMALLAPLLTGACAVGPNYRPPQPSPPATQAFVSTALVALLPEMSSMAPHSLPRPPRRSGVGGGCAD